MKVLQVGKFYPPYAGGIETVTLDINEYLNEHNIKADVLCTNDKNLYVEDIVNGSSIFRTKSWGVFASLSVSFQYVRKFKEIMNNYDIIHVHLPNPLANLALFLAKPSQKIVLHWHSDIIKQKYLLKLYEPLQKWMLKRSNVIIVTSPKYMEESLALRPFLHKCKPIPLGIDENKLQYEKSRVQAIKNEYENKKIVFSLGRMTYYKGFQYLIEAAKYLDDTYVILIGGKGELLEKFKQKINKENLNSRVILLGRVEDDDLGNYYQACDIFCLPSIAKSEAFGVVQIEAMSFGKPVVATMIEGSGVDWVNQDGISGLNVPIENSKALASAFKEILDKSEYEAFKDSARQRFESFFTRDKMGNEMLILYKKLLS